MVRLLLVLLVACGASAPTCPVVPRPTNAPPFLWRVQKADGTGGTVWLYGTIHNGGMDDVPRVALDAFATAPRFVSELGASEPDRDRLADLARIDSGPSLDQLVGTDVWWELRDELRGIIKEDELKRTRPWYAMTRLMRKLAPPPDPTMDFGLTARAKSRGIPVDGLEQWSEQLAALGDSVSGADLAQTVRERATIRCQLQSLLDQYRAGDLAAIAPRLVVAGTKLLEDRNRKWLPQLEQLFDKGGAFVAVGLGHMIGDTGLPALLQGRGFRVLREDGEHDRRESQHTQHDLSKSKRRAAADASMFSTVALGCAVANRRSSQVR